MTIRRSDIVDAGNPGVYHCVSRCVRREFLLDSPERRAWIVDRLRFLANWMAIDVISFAVMHNHIHLLLAIRPDVAEQWSDCEVAERRIMLLPNRRRRRLQEVDPDAPPTRAEISEVMSRSGAVTRARTDLCSLGFFHRLLKEPCARLWNRQDGVTGHFWEGRFKSPRVLDIESLLRVARYIELNQVHAGAASTIESSVWTSAFSQWRQMVLSIQEAVREHGACLTPESIASRLLALEWRPALPCRPGSQSREGVDRQPESSEGGQPLAVSWAGTALGVAECGVTLAIHLRNLHHVGRIARSDKRGCIDRDSTPPVEMALLAAVGRSADWGSSSPPQADSADLILRRFIAACLEVLADLEVLLPGSRCESSHDQEPAVVVTSRGTCYGEPEAVRREARRRGLSRLWVGLRTDDGGLSAA